MHSFLVAFHVRGENSYSVGIFFFNRIKLNKVREDNVSKRNFFKKIFINKSQILCALTSFFFTKHLK